MRETRTRAKRTPPAGKTAKTARPPTVGDLLRNLPPDADPRAVKWLRALLTCGDAHTSGGAQ
jgi:hypothetical protein